MAEISNKTLVGLLVVAIVISLAGTFISLNKLGQMGVTGLQTSNVTQQTGTTSVTLLSTYQLTIYNNTVAWGSGQVNGTITPGIDVCNLTTDADFTSSGNTFSTLGNGGQTAACDGFAAVTPWSMVLENTGNGPFTNVSMTATNGDTAFGTAFIVSGANFMYRIDEEAASACGTGPSATWASVPTAAIEVCGDFEDATANDAFLVQLLMQLPEGANATTFSDTLTFIGNV